MARAVKSHREKKDGAAHDRWMSRVQALRESDPANSILQKLWRFESLMDRIKRCIFTKKNEIEANKLGYKLKLDVSGWPVGLQR